MEQFSHDLSLALEESRITGARSGRWTARRRTRSTGNLPCAPQPTEDSSSSHEDALNHYHNGPAAIRISGVAPPNILSDSDNAATATASNATRFPLSAVPRPDVSLGNFESDSLNETFSPARPCARRKRKFKRMAVEYDTTTTTSSLVAVGGITSRPVNLSAANNFPSDGRARVYSASCVGGHHLAVGGSVGGALTKSVPRYGGSCQENFRANLFFCGKRKRSHRDRYDYDHHRAQNTMLHSSSVPRQREMFSSSIVSSGSNVKGAFLEHLNRKSSAKIQPLNKNIISKIERIAQDSSSTTTSQLAIRVPRPECEFKPIDPDFEGRLLLTQEEENEEEEADRGRQNAAEEEDDTMVAGINHSRNTNHIITFSGVPAIIPSGQGQGHNKSGSLESNFSFQEYGSCSGNSGGQLTGANPSAAAEEDKPTKRHHTRRHHRHKRSAIRMQLQFEDPSYMDCPMADILSSSSLSSSDSETDKTCDSDREGDDELTDWPGNEGTVTLSSGEFAKRTRSQKTLLMMMGGKGALPLIKSDDAQDEDTRMSAEEMGLQLQSSIRMQPVVLPLKPGFVSVTSTGNTAAQVSLSSATGILERGTPSMPIDMPMHVGGLLGGGGGVACAAVGVGGCASVGVGPMIESEMSGETSNHFLSSPNAMNEVREFRAGCRRVREERPSFSVITSVNEDLSRFLQDGRQTQLQLPDTDALEHEKLSHLAKLYSLHMRVDRGMAILTKTSNTTQPVRVDRSNMSKMYLSDFKRRCYEEAAEEQEMNDIQS